MTAMDRVMSAWTSSHTAVAAVVMATSAGAFAANLETTRYAALVAVALVVTATAGLLVDALGGIVVGLVAAAAVTAVKQLDGAWASATFWHSLVETIAMVVTGCAAGLVGRGLRTRGASRGAPVASARVGELLLGPVFGSLGLLDADLGMARLEEEVERAREHRRPLTLALFAAELVDSDLSLQGREAGLRALVRAIETRIQETDVPFAFAENEVAAIMPETSASAAWSRIGRIADALDVAKFRDRETGDERAFCGSFALHIGLAVLGVHATAADALVDAAVDAVQRDAVEPAGAA